MFFSQAKKFYKKIGSIIVPALGNEQVAFNSRGFKHLIRKSETRPRSEQKRRFLLLRYAKKIIENPEAAVVYRENTSQNTITKYWTFVEEIDGRRIKVVIRQINRGMKHFYSIMDKPIMPKAP